MQVTLELPDLLMPSTPDPARTVFEAVALQAYAVRRISQGKLAELLGLDRWQTERLLEERGITQPYHLGDFREEVANLDRTLA